MGRIKLGIRGRTLYIVCAPLFLVYCAVVLFFMSQPRLGSTEAFFFFATTALYSVILAAFLSHIFTKSICGKLAVAACDHPVKELRS